MDRVAGFIREQPDVVPATYRAVRAALATFEMPDAGGIALVGSGSSLNALTAAASDLADGAGRPAHVYGPARFLAELAAGRVPARLAIVLSQSGASRTSVTAAQEAERARLALLRVTAEAASPLAALAPGAVVMPIGPEPIGPKTKGFTASLAALAAIADHLGKRSADPPSLGSDLIEGSLGTAELLAAELDDVDHILVAGDGPAEGIALEASLKISEMSGVPSAGYSVEEALHGRFHGLTRRSLALFIPECSAGRDEIERAARVMGELGCRTHVIEPAIGPTTWSASPDERRGDVFNPLRAIVPFQWLAWALARRRGLDPAEMRYPGLSARLGIKTTGARSNLPS